MSTLPIKLGKTKIGEDRLRRIDAAKLKVLETEATFQLKLRNHFQSLEEESVEPDLGLAQKAEEAAAQESFKTLYTIAKKKKIRGGCSRRNSLVKDENGRAFSRVEDNLKRWQEFFHSILNRPEPENTAPIPEAT